MQEGAKTSCGMCQRMRDCVISELGLETRSRAEALRGMNNSDGFKSLIMDKSTWESTSVGQDALLAPLVRVVRHSEARHQMRS